MTKKEYIRSKADVAVMGYKPEEHTPDERKDVVHKGQVTGDQQQKLLEKITAQNIDFAKPLDEQIKSAGDEEDVNKSVLEFAQNCYSCNTPGSVKMCQCSIPYFKELIIMAFSCEACGYKSTEIKQGGGISEKATRLVFKVNEAKDLNRDVFKSDSCVLAIPEVDLILAPGTMGALYTTIEGLIVDIVDNLRKNNPFG